MLAEVFILRLEADLRASKLVANDTRFVAIDALTLPAIEMSRADPDMPLATELSRGAPNDRQSRLA